MSALHDLQQGFAGALFNETDRALFATRIRTGGLNGERRMRIYLNNLRTTLSEALGAMYTVSERLVGPAFFRQVARSYVQEIPSRSGDLRRYGENFPDFLSRQPGLEQYAFVGDVARLEWAIQQVVHSEFKRCLNPRALAAVAPDHYPLLRFGLQPAARLMASDYPVHRIWQVNRDGWTGDAAVRVDGGRVWLLILRGEESIGVEPIAAQDFQFLKTLSFGATLSDAIDAVWSSDPEFDPAAALRRFVASGVIVDFFEDVHTKHPESFFILEN